MGYESHAHYVLEYNMAKTPAGAEDFLLRVWRPGLAQAKRERADMQSLMGETTFAAWDWWHLAEKLRLARYDLLRITCKLASRMSKWTTHATFLLQPQPTAGKCSIKANARVPPDDP